MTPQAPTRGSTTDLEAAVAANAGASPAKRTLQDLINKQLPEIARAVPPHTLDPERFVRVILTEVSRIPRLADCTRETFLGAMFQSAQLGLEPGGALGQAFMLPYRNRKAGTTECQFQIGYKGYVSLLGRQGILVEAREVHEGDDFEFEFGTNPFLRHKYDPREDRGDIVCYYGTAEFKDGKRRFHVMSIRDIEKRRARAQAKDDGPWKTDYEAMCRKTVIRAMVPQLPMSPETAVAVTADDAIIERSHDGEFRYNYAEAIDVTISDAGTASGAEQDSVIEALNGIEDNTQRLACSRYLRENYGDAASLDATQIPHVLEVIRTWPLAIESAGTAQPSDDGDTQAFPVQTRGVWDTITHAPLRSEAAGWLETEFGPDPSRWDDDAVALALAEWLEDDTDDSATRGPQEAAGGDEPPPPARPAKGGTRTPTTDETLEYVRTRVDTWPEDVVDRVLGDWSLPKTGAIKTKRLRLVTAIAPEYEAGNPAATSLF
jgi:recombination protein RecT